MQESCLLGPGLLRECFRGGFATMAVLRAEKSRNAATRLRRPPAYSLCYSLLQSSSVAYRLGVSGPFWYAAGATVQVLLFSSNAIKLKQNAPYARTYLEIIRTRWGNVGHATFLFFGLATNIMVSPVSL